MEHSWRHHTSSGTYVGKPATGIGLRLRGLLRELRESRRILLVFTVSRFRARFRAQALGVVWPIANPLILMVVMSVVFGLVFRNEVEAYPVFLMLGLVLWQFVTHAWTEGTNCMVRHANVVKRTAVPAWVVAVGTVLSHLYTLAFASMSIIPLVGFYPEAFRVSLALLTIPLWLGLLLLAAVGAVLATSVFNVFYRDMGYVVDSTLLVVFWATPIIWPLSQIAEPIRPIILANPVAAVLEGLRAAVMEGAMAPAPVLASAVIGSVTLFVVGCWVYIRLGDRIADHV